MMHAKLLLLLVILQSAVALKLGVNPAMGRRAAVFGAVCSFGSLAAPASAALDREEVRGIVNRATRNELSTDRVKERASKGNLLTASEVDCSTLDKVERIDRKAYAEMAVQLREEKDPEKLKKLQAARQQLSATIARNYDAYQIQCIAGQ